METQLTGRRRQFQEAFGFLNDGTGGAVSQFGPRRHEGGYVALPPLPPSDGMCCVVHVKLI